MYNEVSSKTQTIWSILKWTVLRKRYGAHLRRKMGLRLKIVNHHGPSALYNQDRTSITVSSFDLEIFGN